MNKLLKWEWLTKIDKYWQRLIMPSNQNTNFTTNRNFIYSCTLSVEIDKDYLFVWDTGNPIVIPLSTANYTHLYLHLKLNTTTYIVSQNYLKFKPKYRSTPVHPSNYNQPRRSQIRSHQYGINTAPISIKRATKTTTPDVSLCAKWTANDPLKLKHKPNSAKTASHKVEITLTRNWIDCHGSANENLTQKLS